ncbi:MAG: HEAT repeat domain-containing protein [Anaerolineales bacterium]|jgi:HEAT repeat protein
MSGLKQLLEDLTSGDEPRAENAAVQFISHGDKGFEALQILVTNTDEDTRWWALRAVSEFGTPQSSEILIAALHDPATSVQMCAAVGLRLHPDPNAIEPLTSLLDSTAPLLAKVAGDALAAIGKPATQPLIQVIENSESTHRVKLEAVRVLASIKDTSAISTLFKVSQEGSSMMQYWAEKGLDNLGIGMMFFDPS